MIMSQVNKIKDVMAFVFIDDEFKGCAVIFKNENYILVVTAYHVISTAVSHMDNCFHRIKIKMKTVLFIQFLTANFVLKKILQYSI
ncbi:hypothetical protein DSN37_07230 [Salmonella enterica subsp. enterica serovar Kuessel]|nr:hypothetical protein [Salmonella enterica subsp. enterica serovar Kuessel]